jgi:hypothetical protein
MLVFRVKTAQRVVCTLTLAFLASGCEQLQGLSMSSDEKIEQSFPLSAQLTQSESKLFALVLDNKDESTRLKSRLTQLRTIRAMSCAGITSVGRFETITQLRSKAVDPECIKKHDVEIADFIGIEHIAILSKKPPLRPFSPLAKDAVIPFADVPVGFLTAESANVAVVQNSSGLLTIMDLSGGKPISTFQAAGDFYHRRGLSPNGRILALSISHRRVDFYDTEAGVPIWSTDKFSQVLSWLPQSNGLVVTGDKSLLNGTLSFVTGRLEPYLIGQRKLTWASSVPNAEMQRLVGTEKNVFLVDHIKEKDNAVRTNIVKQWTIKSFGVTSQSPMFFANGKLMVFYSGRDLAWLNLETNEQGTWTTSLLNASRFHKINDSQLIMSVPFTSAGAEKAKVIDLERNEILSVADSQISDARWLGFSSQSGLISFANNALVFSRAVDTQNPLSLESELAKASLEKQIAKLQQESEPIGKIRTPEPTDERHTPRAAYEAIRAIMAQRSLTETHSALAQPLLTDVSNNASVSVIGVYEPKRNSANEVGNITVKIQPSAVPLILVLSSYEAVRWNIVNPSGRKIEAILMSSYKDSTIAGSSRTRTLRIGSTSAHKLGSPSYEQLKRDIARYLPNSIKSFQGTYSGSEFSVYE